MLKEFNIDEFKELYPLYKDVTEIRISQAYALACLLHKRYASYEDMEEKNCKYLLFLLISHILGLEERGDRLVGTLTNASEGSISTAFSFTKNEKASWFCQSQSGATYYQLLQKKPKARYYAGR